MTMYKATGKPLLVQRICLTARNHRRDFVWNMKSSTSHRMIVSDQWFVEGDKAWFLSTDRNELFQVNMSNKKIFLLSRVPEEHPRWRGVTHCCKHGDYIYCLPDTGMCIWQYAICTKEWKKKTFDVPASARLSVYEYWVLENEILFYSRGLMQFFLISLKDGEICQCDSIPGGTINGMDYVHAGVERVRDFIYVVSSTPNVYQYDIKNRSIRKCQINFPHDMTIIRYDGNSFWLSGKHKAIYEWNEGKNIIKKYDLPNAFGLYNFDKSMQKLLDTTVNEYPHTTFVDARVVGGYVWFFPFQTNDIVYINTNTKDLKIFSIVEEKETDENLYVRALNYKYIVEYVRSDRYIGLLSLKNNRIIEIDAMYLKYEIKEYDTSSVSAISYGMSELDCEDILGLISADPDLVQEKPNLNKIVGDLIYRYVII